MIASGGSWDWGECGGETCGGGISLIISIKIIIYSQHNCVMHVFVNLNDSKTRIKLEINYFIFTILRCNGHY